MKSRSNTSGDDGAVAFFYGDVTVVWNKSATFNVYLFGKEVDVFTNYSAPNVDMAREVIGDWLKEREYI
jgi:hypothetical protein